MLSKILATSNLTKSLRLCKRFVSQASHTSSKQNSDEFQADETHFGFQRIKESEKVGKGENLKFVQFLITSDFNLLC